MLISYSHQFIFIHTAKTAGTSICRELSPYAHPSEERDIHPVIRRVGPYVNRFLPYRSRTFRIHDSARTVRAQLPPEIYDRCFKFAFVRNPWDRAVSYYHFVRDAPRHHRHRRLRDHPDFAAFLRHDRKLGRLLQKKKVTDPEGHLIVDYVGRFESLQRDFQYICRRLKIPCHLPHLNRSRHRDYRSYYDRETYQVVADMFALDIDFFGYAFDGLAA